MFFSKKRGTSSITCGESGERVSQLRLVCALAPENAEVFRKETLQTRGMDEKRGKQKKRDRVSKTVSQSSSKSKVRYPHALTVSLTVSPPSPTAR